ncbi:MAG: stage II sporulation protein M [bacterium]
MKTDGRKIQFSLKHCYFIITTLFLIAIICGLFLALNNSDYATKIDNDMKQGAIPFIGLTPLNLFLRIFVNNIWATLFTTFPFFFFGLLAFFDIISNGLRLGVMAVVVVDKQGLAWFLAGVFTHGIFEFPALIIADGIGLWLGYLLFRKLFFKEHKQFRDGFKKGLIIFLKIVIPLLLVAAIVEAFITPKLMAWVK